LEQGVPWVQLGSVGGTTLSMPSLMDAPLDKLETAWRGGLAAALG